MSFMTTDNIDLLRRTHLSKFTKDEQDLFLVTVERTQLDPFARQIWPQGRWDGKLQREVMSILITIDGMRSVAERTGEYEGQLGPFWCDKDGKWVDVWTQDHHPHAGRVGVLRKGFREPLWSVARFDAYKATVNEKNAQGKPTGAKRVNDVWMRMGDLMIAKCAEALSLRRAFPNQLGGLYTEDEFEQALRDAAEERAAAAGTTTGATDPGKGAELMPARKEPAPQAEPQGQAANAPSDIEQAADVAERELDRMADEVAAEVAAPAPVANPGVTGFKVDLPPGPHGVLTSKLATAGLTEDALLAGIAKDVSIKTVNEAFSWIKANAKQ